MFSLFFLIWEVGLMVKHQFVGTASWEFDSPPSRYFKYKFFIKNMNFLMIAFINLTRF